MGFPPGPGGPGQGVPSSSPGFRSPPAFVAGPLCEGSSQHKAPCSTAPSAAPWMCSSHRPCPQHCEGRGEVLGKAGEVPRRQAGCTW